MTSPEIITLPGAVDLHVHLREPSTNKAETISSGTQAARLGGYALVADMPNNPGHETWSVERILEKYDIIKRTANTAVGLYAGSQPDHDNTGELAKMAPYAIGLKLYGARTTGNDKDFTAENFRPIVKEWHRVAPDKPIMFHAGKNNLADMIGVVAKDIGHHLHVCHVNDPEQVRVVNMANVLNLQVTCGVCPHHLFKTSHDEKTEGWFARMQPPLASQIDSDELFYQLVNGDIDVVESDHAPHSKDSKNKAEKENPLGFHDSDHTTCFGVPGIGQVLTLLFYQVKRGSISLSRVIEATSTKPAEILGVTVSPNTKVEWFMQEYRIEHDRNNPNVGGSEWSPYIGMLAVGRVLKSNVGDRRVVSQRGEII